MRKQSWIWTVALCAGLCMAVLPSEVWLVVQAKEEGAGERESLRIQESSSRGNLVYWDGLERAGIYAADFAFLYGKLSAVSGVVFDPAEYTYAYEEESEASYALTFDVIEEFPEPEPPEAVKEESSELELSDLELEEVLALEAEEIFEISVSGNDCAGEETEEETEEETGQETEEITEEGDNL